MKINQQIEDVKYSYLHDCLSSVRQMINTSGNSVKLYTYEPFGEVLETDGTLDNVFMFTGQHYDDEVDEYFLRARQYDPHIARFTARDPVFGKFHKPLTLHRYLYCLNDTVNMVDPEGRFAYNLVSPILTGYALYFHGIDLATYAVSSENWKFWDLAQLTFEFMPIGMSIVAITPTPALSRLYLVYAGAGSAAGIALEEAFQRTGMSYPEALSMDPAAFFAYSSFMFTAEMLFDISGDDMADFARWHGRLWGSMWE